MVEQITLTPKGKRGNISNVENYSLLISMKNEHDIPSVYLSWFQRVFVIQSLALFLVTS